VKHLFFFNFLGLLYLFADWIFIEIVIRSARGLHSSMLFSILRSKMSFFEQTPVGRIINRFSKDIDAIESSIPGSYRSLLSCLIQVISTILVISISTPFFLIPLVPIVIVYILCQVTSNP
jgi:ABC-type bacteriocin/lantibiotic exporter with double-glycine peptidase domain